jgi:hypothetical protein
MSKRSDEADTTTDLPRCQADTHWLYSICHPEWEKTLKKGPWASGDLKQPVRSINIQFRHFTPWACNSCKRGAFTGTKLLKCGGCHLFRYCCKDHQVEHWAQHKRFCKAVKRLASSDEGAGMSAAASAAAAGQLGPGLAERAFRQYTADCCAMLDPF